MLRMPGDSSSFRTATGAVRGVNAALFSQERAPQSAMPPLPRDEAELPLNRLKTLETLEARIRDKSVAIDHRTIGNWIKRLEDNLSPYWSQIGLLLLSNVAKKRDSETFEQVKSHLDRVFNRLAENIESSPMENPMGIDSSPLFGPLANENVKVLEFQDERQDLDRQFAYLADSHERDHGPIGSRNLLQARRIVFERLAARGESDSLTPDRFKSILRSLSD